MAYTTDSFIPALGAHWLTPLYDSLIGLMGEGRFKAALIHEADLRPGQAVLDIGCGTGTLALMAWQACPQAQVTGLDIDPRILAIAKRKLEAAGAAVTLCHGSATAPPFASASFDRVLTTLMLHHLPTPQKHEMLAAVRRILRPGGELHIADWGKPHNTLMRLAATSIRLLDGSDTTGTNLRGELPSLLKSAEFVDVREGQRWMTPFERELES